MLAAFAGGNALAVVPSGYLSDRMGRRTLLIIGLTASGVATLQGDRARRLAELALGLGQGETGLRQSYQDTIANSLVGEAAARSAAGGNLVGLGLKGLDVLKALIGAG